jgi:hypothetical protein
MKVARRFSGGIRIRAKDQSQVTHQEGQEDEVSPTSLGAGQRQRQAESRQWKKQHAARLPANLVQEGPDLFRGTRRSKDCRFRCPRAQQDQPADGRGAVSAGERSRGSNAAAKPVAGRRPRELCSGQDGDQNPRFVPSQAGEIEGDNGQPLLAPIGLPVKRQSRKHQAQEEDLLVRHDRKGHEECIAGQQHREEQAGRARAQPGGHRAGGQDRRGGDPRERQPQRRDSGGQLAHAVDHQLQQREPAIAEDVVAAGDPPVRIVPIHHRISANQRRGKDEAGDRHEERQRDAKAMRPVAGRFLAGDRDSHRFSGTGATITPCGEAGLERAEPLGKRRRPGTESELVAAVACPPKPPRPMSQFQK